MRRGIVVAVGILTATLASVGAVVMALTGAFATVGILDGHSVGANIALLAIAFGAGIPCSLWAFDIWRDLIEGV